jgi:hypothetical protein
MLETYEVRGERGRRGNMLIQRKALKRVNKQRDLVLLRSFIPTFIDFRWNEILRQENNFIN